jgi:deferrochelatase/peroxidase EfeB
VSGVSRRRFLQGAAGGGAAVAAGAVGVSRLARGEGEDGLVPWRGPRQAGITTPRTDHAIVAAFDVLDDDLAGLLRELTARIAELTEGRPDGLDPIENTALPPSDTGELGYERRRDGRLTITVGRGASLFDRRFGLRGRRPHALRRMPSFPGDNLGPYRCHGDLALLFQADHPMLSHHALRDVMRRARGRLQGRWAHAMLPAHRRVEDRARRRGPKPAGCSASSTARRTSSSSGRS